MPRQARTSRQLPTPVSNPRTRTTTNGGSRSGSTPSSEVVNSPQRSQERRRRALRDTHVSNQPSPSRRRIPCTPTSRTPRIRTTDENRPPPPQLALELHNPQAVTPPPTQPPHNQDVFGPLIDNIVSPSRDPQIHERPVVINRRAVAQQARRHRERLAAAGASTPQRPQPLQPPASITTPSVVELSPDISSRSRAQRARRQREQHTRAAHQGIQPPTLPTVFQDPPANLGQLALAYNRSKIRRSKDLFGAARRPYVEPNARHDLGLMIHPCQHCGALHWFDERIVDSPIRKPEFGMCCAHGQVNLPALADPPAPLRELFTAQTPQAIDFRENSWKYNRAFAFTSLCVKEDHSVNEGRGEPVFRIQGELCHRGGSLTPAPGRAPVYAQLYIYEPHAALEYRMSNNSDLRPDTLEIIQDVLLHHHQYASIYKHAYEVLQDYDSENDVSVRLRVGPGLDRRRYNLPTADEVAVILPTDASAADKRDIILHCRSGALQTISDLHPAYIPLFYVLLFPYGENGWHPGLLLRQHEDSASQSHTAPSRHHHRRRHPSSHYVEGENLNPEAQDGRMSLIRFVAYRLQVRRNEFLTLLRGGRLFQRFLVDMYAIVDQQRLLYLRLHQGKLRASLYNGLEDAVSHDRTGDQVDLHEIGQRIILPSSYIGGPRHMYQRFQDSLAIARFFGKVDIFMTVTCNPHWPEIERELLPGQTAYDRPDLVSRVFQLKKKAILDYIFKHGAFGNTVAHVYTIEFQKRGLPHMHLLIFLEEPYKLLSVDAIDSCIWARWPDPDQQPLLFETVMNCMVHGPCGAANPESPCMEKGKCTKGFPKPFQESTTMDHNGFPLYYRPDDGRAYQKHGVMVDNRWIVPYSPFFSAEFNCHINCECAVSLGSLKYLFKYIQKGGDMASVELRRRDEIQAHLNGRYISAAEAVHHMLQFDVHDQKPNVVRLHVHLPGQHMVVFDPDEDPDKILDRASHERTQLTSFFNANTDPELSPLASQLTYQEFPQKFVWNVNLKCWTVRQLGFAIGRMYFIPPNVWYQTFHAACLARGLLQDDGEWRQCLAEASVMQTGARLRHLFCTILLFCEPAQPDILWLEFRSHICDDLHWRLQSLGLPNPTEDEVFDYGLYLLDQLLRESSRSLSDWPSMPRPVHHWNEQSFNPLIAEQLGYDRNREREQLNSALPLLNNGQAHAYHTIVRSAHQALGKVFLLSGPGGTGKTFVYKAVCNRLRSDGHIVLCVSSSGISALLLPGGRTAHSTFKIPIDGLTPESFCQISKESQRANLLRMTRAIIWDEIGPQHRFAPEALDRTLRDLRNSNLPFGGVTVVFGGDFQQTLPVVVRGSREEIVNATIQSSPLWKHIEVLYLHENMRVRDDPNASQFASWLLDIGHGRNTTSDGSVVFPEPMITPDAQGLIDFIYRGIASSPPPPPEFFFDRMILAPRNADVMDINESVLNLMVGEARTYYSADEVIHEPGADSNHTPLTSEYLRSINVPSLPPGELTIKVGCPLILLRNLAPWLGLCNGTRMIVTRMSDRVLEVRLLGGDHDGEIAFIPRVSLIPTATADFAFRFRRRQFPVRLAFALTINKAQGQSISGIAVLTNPRAVNDNRNVYFDANFWLPNDTQILALLHYYNLENYEFPCDMTCFVEASVVAMNAEADLKVLEQAEGTLDRREYQLVGDLLRLCPAAESVDPRVPPVLSVAAVVKSSSRDDSPSTVDNPTFSLNGTQWLTAFRDKPTAATLPVRVTIRKCHRFADPKKVCPNNNTWVLAAGSLLTYTTDEQTGQLKCLDIEIKQSDTLAFMGKYSPPFTPIKRRLSNDGM
ncbi:hypothetical protein ONZ45_g18233 [Pleurotus djamor]|nr:hypothetical protein ONZ45_g18233 [Pleurotus djamor]